MLNWYRRVRDLIRLSDSRSEPLYLRDDADDDDDEWILP